MKLTDEASIFGQYILGKSIDIASTERYLAAISREPPNVGRDAAIVEFCLRHRWSIGMLDGALALLGRRSTLRRRLIILAAILEASPLYCDDFLPVSRSFTYRFVVLFVALRAVASAAAGCLLLPFLK
jgi:hypothetical protein